MSKNNNELNCFFELLIKLIRDFGIGIDYDSSIRNWQNYRDNFMKNDQRLVKEYKCANEVLGETIAFSSSDKSNVEFYQSLYDGFIVYFNKALEEGRNERAQSVYNQIVKLLLVFFSLQPEYDRLLSGDGGKKGGFFSRCGRPFRMKSRKRGNSGVWYLLVIYFNKLNIGV